PRPHSLGGAGFSLPIRAELGLLFLRARQQPSSPRIPSYVPRISAETRPLHTEGHHPPLSPRLSPRLRASASKSHSRVAHPLPPRARPCQGSLRLSLRLCVSAVNRPFVNPSAYPSNRYPSPRTLR